MIPQNTTLYYSMLDRDDSAGEWGLVIGWWVANANYEEMPIPYVLKAAHHSSHGVTFGKPQLLDTQARVFFHRDQAIAQRTYMSRAIPQ